MRARLQQEATRQLRAASRLIAILLLAPVAAVAQTAGGGQEGGVQGSAERGEVLFGELGCNGCHKVKGIGGEVGPDLSGIFALDLRKDRAGDNWPSVDAYIRESLQEPQKYIVPRFPNPSPMPSARQFELTEQGTADLIAYLAAVSKSAGPFKTGTSPSSQGLTKARDHW